MSLLAKYRDQAKAATVEKEKDSLGGSVLESAVYPMTIKMAYLKTADSGATGLVLKFAYAGDKEFRTTEWPISGNAKGNKHYYERNGKNNPLPGFTIADDLCMAATGKGFFEQEDESKPVPIYNFESGGDVLTEVPVLTDLIGANVKLGIRKVIEDKNVKDNMGNYVPSGQTRELNEISKVFTEDGLTSSEVADGNPAEFITKWEARNNGAVIDKSGKSGKPSAATSGGIAAKLGAAPAPSGMFSKK